MSELSILFQEMEVSDRYFEYEMSTIQLNTEVFTEDGDGKDGFFTKLKKAVCDFIDKIIKSIKGVFEKFSTSKACKNAENAMAVDPSIKNQKAKMTDWKKVHVLNKATRKKIEAAKSKEEVDKIMGSYAEKSFEKYKKEYLDLMSDVLNPAFAESLINKAEAYAMEKVQREMEQGYQGIEYKLNTVGSSRGDYPFVTFSFGLGTGKFEKMCAKTILNVHREGQGKKGFKRPVLFPKLVFLYDKNIHGEGKECNDVFEAGIQCSAASMYPDWLSMSGEGYISNMYQKYGTAISPMGKCILAHVKRHSTASLAGVA